MKSFKKFINDYKLSQNLKDYRITNYTINQDGSIDVDDGVSLWGFDLIKLPLKFRNVTGHFWCSHNQLTSLKGSPQSVGGVFDCSNNQLTSLEGCPQNAILYDCRNNKLTSLQGLPEDIDKGHFDGNPVWEIYNLFNTIKCIKWLNEFDVIRGNTVIMDLLEEVFHQLEMDIPKNITFVNYEII
jgi:hypothetical protein